MVGTKEGLSVVSDATTDMPDPDLLSAATATMLSTGDFLSDKYKEGLTREIMVHVNAAISLYSGRELITPWRLLLVT